MPLLLVTCCGAAKAPAPASSGSDQEATLVERAKLIDSPTWLEAQRQLVMEANAMGHVRATPRQVDEQLRLYQALELGKILAQMKLSGLYALFDQTWQVRLDAAHFVLKRSTLKDVPDFLHHLPKDASTKAALAEPIMYGALIVAMDSADGPRPRDVLTPFLRGDNLGAKLTAIGAYYAGEKSEAGGLTALEDDRTALPTCDPGDKCGWTCDVPKIGSPDTETKTITTVGEFVRWCVEPSLW